ncbi:VWA domain-containing protein [Sphingobacteriales bacterium UPWRP_1]|nr:hypothetical protein BVG80_02310 [Sphingobacteriales bacterium TSM_CSM]PSJ75175.1 VWA domain-containing protein [Sphingobacteriales bacterium UPWRP_1]
MQNLNFNDVDFNLSYNNFNPEDIQVDETVNAVFVVDVSPSVAGYINELNHALNDFTAAMQQSHIADRLLVSVVEFCEKVKVKSGFQPVAQLPTFGFKPTGGGTALHDAALQGLKMALDYRNNLEASGVNTKTLLFIITDGEDNSSSHGADEVKNTLQQVLASERNAFSFVSVLFGVGNAASFGQAQKDMGIQHLAKVGTSGAEIKRMIGFISRSVSSAAANAPITF